MVWHSQDLFIGSKEIISALFGYGSFDEEAVLNSSKALYYFGLGLPAFAFIKVFSSFVFARQNTKIPFYFSLISVIFNIIISLYFFNKIGFIIIPIATSMSSWLNSLLLLFYLIYKNYFNFKLEIIISFIRIVLVSLITSFIFYYLVDLTQEYLAFESGYKLVTMLAVVVLTLIIYIMISIITKAFKISDIKLKY